MGFAAVSGQKVLPEIHQPIARHAKRLGPANFTAVGAGNVPSQDTVVVSSATDTVTIEADRCRLVQVFTNLLVNAARYTDPGGEVWLAAAADAAAAVVRVRDTGRGIPADLLSRLFEPFHRVESSRNRETGGTGLGLPIARNIFRAHGGDVSLANRPTGGIRVVATLPI